MKHHFRRNKVVRLVTQASWTKNVQEVKKGIRVILQHALKSLISKDQA